MYQRRLPATTTIKRELCNSLGQLSETGGPRVGGLNRRVDQLFNVHPRKWHSYVIVIVAPSKLLCDAGTRKLS